MPDETQHNPAAENGHKPREDEPVPTASEDRVLDETARLAREGRRELENDPKETRRDE